MFQSLVGRIAARAYTYDMYTAHQHTAYTYDTIGIRSAVGITDGLAAVDKAANDKQEREKHYPLELLRVGMAFRCLEGDASVKEDKDRIVTEIGDGHLCLDNTVHGVVAASSLRRALEEGHGPEFLEVQLSS